MSKPEEPAEVLAEMKKYCKKKGFNFSDSRLEVEAETCYWFYEARGWKYITFWPAVAYKWILSIVDKQDKQQNYKRPKPKGKTVRDIILEKENEV